MLASAVGPLLLARCVAFTGSYATAFYGLAAVVAVLAVVAALVAEPTTASHLERSQGLRS